MQAVILAAGRSTRTIPLTKNIPKPMLQVLDKPIIHHTIDQIKDLADEIIIIVGYKKDQIITYIKENLPEINIKFIEQKEQLGTGHAIMLAKELLYGKFLILPGDDLFSKIDVKMIISEKYCILAKEVEDPKRFGVLITKDDKVVGIEEKPANPPSNLISTACWVMDKKIIDLMERQGKSKRGEFEITSALSELLKTEDVVYKIVEDYWIPISYPEDWITANMFLLEKHRENNL